MRCLILAALLFAGCATNGGPSLLEAAGYSLDAYCRLTPEARADVRKRLHLSVQLVRCER